VVQSSQPDADEKLAVRFGAPLSLQSSAPEGTKLEFAAGTLSGKFAEVTEVDLAGAAPAGTFFDYASIHLVTTSALQKLQEAYPQGQFSIQRFRPNLVVDCGEETGFVENSWVDRTISIGNELVLRASIPCPRCVMTTLPRNTGLPLDPGIVRTAAQLNRLDLGELGRLPCVGLYANVVTPGRIRRGDPIEVSH